MTPMRSRPLAAFAAGMFIIVMPARADQFKVAADNARVDCTVAKKDVSRISLVGDEFAAVTKASAGMPYNDFSVVNEPVRGDIYISVPETYAARTISFFGTSKKGYVYKFVCAVASVEAQQVFVTNPGIAASKAAEWEGQADPQETAVRLIQAMSTQAMVEGYQVRQTTADPTLLGSVSVRLIAEYRGAAYLGKVFRIENKGTAPVSLKEADLAPQGTLAITLASQLLAPGQATTAYLVLKNGG